MPPPLPRTHLQPSHQVLNYSLNFLKFCFLYHFVTEYAFDIRETAGPSMLPTISTAGDSVLISKSYRRGRGIAVGDMVSIRHPIMPEEGAIKRVLGLPGDYVGRDTPVGVREDVQEQDIGAVGEEEEEQEGERGMGEEGRGRGWERRSREEMMIQVPEGHCWIIGDNLGASRDSRFYGPLPLAMIKGKVIARVWPLSRRGWFENTLKRPEEKGWE